jgi:hypothetical protein
MFGDEIPRAILLDYGRQADFRGLTQLLGRPIFEGNDQVKFGMTRQM